MRFKGFVGSSYNLKNTQYDCQRTVNWYPEVDETTLGKNAEIAQLAPTPGLRAVATDLAGPSRGGYVSSAGKLYWVFGNTLYGIRTNEAGGWETSKLSTIIAGAGDVQFTDNGVSMFMVSSGNGYVMDMTTFTVTSISEPGWNQASSVTYFDTYVVFSKRNSNQFFWTDPLSTAIPALNFASAEANTDRIVGLINNNEDLWIFGKKTIELWYNYGSNGITFSRRPSILIETGCSSADTIKKLNNTLIWLGEDDRGGPQLMMANSYTPVRVSTNAVEQQWARLSAGRSDEATAYTYQSGGHHFYVLNIPGQTSTWVYDLTASQQLGQPIWHERQSLDPFTELQNRHNSQSHAYFGGYHLTGDYRDGNLYIMDEDYYTDNGVTITRTRVAPHISAGMNRVFFAQLVLDFATGTSTTMVDDPQVMLQFSDDGGKSWSLERWTSVGMTGDYTLKVDFHRLGSARNRVFRIQVTDPIYWAISGADIELSTGAH